MAVAGPVVLKTTVTAMCSVKDKSPGSITIFLRGISYGCFNTPNFYSLEPILYFNCDCEQQH